MPQTLDVRSFLVFYSEIVDLLLELVPNVNVLNNWDFKNLSTCTWCLEHKLLLNVFPQFSTFSNWNHFVYCIWAELIQGVHPLLREVTLKECHKLWSNPLLCFGNSQTFDLDFWHTVNREKFRWNTEILEQVLFNLFLFILFRISNQRDLNFVIFRVVSDVVQQS